VKLGDLKHVPSWLLMLIPGVTCLLFGAAKQVSIAGNSIQLESPMNYVVMAIGVALATVGTIAAFHHHSRAEGMDLPVRKVTMESLTLVNEGEYPRGASWRARNPPEGGGARVDNKGAPLNPTRSLSCSPRFCSDGQEWRMGTNDEFVGRGLLSPSRDYSSVSGKCRIGVAILSNRL
jgi:hypothetical protein